MVVRDGVVRGPTVGANVEAAVGARGAASARVEFAADLGGVFVGPLLWLIIGSALASGAFTFEMPHLGTVVAPR